MEMHVNSAGNDRQGTAPPIPATICPRCQTVLFRAGERCVYCDFPLAWIENVPEVRNALRDIASSASRELLIRIEWAGGNWESRTDGVTPLEFSPPSAVGGWRFRLEPGGDSLLIDLPNRTEGLILPAARQWVDGLACAARLVATVSDDCPRPDIAARGEGNQVIGDRLVIGSRFGSDQDHVRRLAVDSPDIRPRHATIVRRLRLSDGTGSREPEFWLIPLAADCPVFVNQKRILTRRLEAADLIQIGASAWTFDEDDQCLIAAAAIRGSTLTLEQATLGERIPGPVSLQFAAGEMTAIIGPSGCGKSTILKMLPAAPGSRTGGSVAIDGVDADTSPTEFRRRIAYVDQSDEVLLPDLTALQTVIYAAALRGLPASRVEAADLLGQVDLSLAQHNKLVAELSGGERKRVQIAAALAGHPGMLALDEPDSGLDPDRKRRLVRLLRGLAFRGCTVVMVTHEVTDLKPFDHVIKVAPKGHIASDEPPDCENSGSSRIKVSAEIRSSEMSHRRPSTMFTGWLRQTMWHFCRELQRLSNALPTAGSWKNEQRRTLHWRMLVTFGVLPLLFAAILLTAAPSDNAALTGFLVGLCSIWMGASLGLTSIVDEARAADHERLSFLRWDSWLTAKWAVLALLSTLQSVLFVLLLRGLQQRLFPDTVLPKGLGDAWAPIIALGVAGVGLGLFISGIAKVLGSREAAHLLLPLVMLAQIVFSVHVAGVGKKSTQEAYNEFHWSRCSTPDCTWPVTSWNPQTGKSRCEDCALNPPPADANVPRKDQKALTDRSHGTSHRWTARRAALFFSYLTLSRPGDILLRQDSTAGPWHPHAWRAIGAWIVFLPMLACAVVVVGERWRAIKRRDSPV